MCAAEGCFGMARSVLWCQFFRTEFRRDGWRLPGDMNAERAVAVRTHYYALFGLRVIVVSDLASLGNGLALNVRTRTKCDNYHHVYRISPGHHAV